MNISKYLIKEKKLSMIHTDPHLLESMFKKVISWLPNSPREYVVVCIGTDRSTGDSLGPLVGTYFTQMRPKHITIYGSLHKPVHAKNLNNYIDKINQFHKNPFIIAIDACLGRSRSVGNIIMDKGPLIPGAALSKKLPSIGDIHITGVVNISGFMEFSILQNTRLSLVYDLAKCIANILNMIDQQLVYNKAITAVVASNERQPIT